MNPVCDLLDPLFDNAKLEIFGEILEAHKPPTKKKGPAISGMKKDQLIAECERLELETTGKVADLKLRIKEVYERQNSLDDVFKNFDAKHGKDAQQQDHQAGH